MKEHAEIGDTLYFYFASNDTSGSGDDGASAAAHVRLAGAAASAAPVLSPSPTLLSHASYPDGCYEVAVAATVGNGFSAGNTYSVFCSLAVDSQNPTGFIGKFMLDPIIANVKEVSDDENAADNLELACDNYSATRGLAGTALPNAAADAAGGLPISDAGGLNLDNLPTNQTIILNRLGSITGSGDNTLLGFFKALLNKAAATPSDIGGTFDPATDSTEAIRDRGDVAWTTGGGGSITDILNVYPLIPLSVDLANTATVRLGLMLVNALDDLPSTAEITPGTISIERKAIGGTSWSAVVTDAACSELAGMIYYDEVFDSGSGYAEGDTLRITLKGQKITVDANDYELTDSNGRMFYTEIRQTMRGTNNAALATVCTEARLSELDAANLPSDIAALPSDQDVVDELMAEVLESGKTFKQALLDLWAVIVGDSEANDADDPTSITYDSPDGTVQRTHSLTDTTRTQS